MIFVEMLNKYPNAASVENALDKGIAAYNQSEDNKTDISKVIDACCEAEVSEGNYNLIKTSEVSFSSRLQDNAEEIVSSTAANAVTGWIPVEYGKYYSFSVFNGTERKTTITGTAGLIKRINGKKSDGTVIVYGQNVPYVNNVTNSTIEIPTEDIVAVELHIVFGTHDISSADKLKAFQPMFVEGDTAENALNNTKTFEYIDGDIEMPSETIYTLKNTVTTKGKKLLIFGDSITETADISDDGATYTEGAKTNWPTYAKKKLEVSEMWNYAKSGARWVDFSSESVRQKLSHQIETAISNNRPADIIVISAGTNDNSSGVIDTYEIAMEKEISELDRTIFSEAVRWSMYTLRNAYPNAICFVATPIQRAAGEIDSNLVQAIVTMAKRYNFIVIPAHDESGIVRDFELQGASGRDLLDGLHPNGNGKRKMSNLYCSYILRYII